MTFNGRDAATPNQVVTYTISVYMAGDIEQAKQVLRGHCYRRGLCVTVTPTHFIYTGGEETGYIVGFVNYPRFPCAPADLWERAREIVHDLLVVGNQRSALFVAPDRTEWISENPPGAR